MENIPITIKNLEDYPGAIPDGALVFVGAANGLLYKTTIQGLRTALGVPSHTQAISSISGLQAALDSITTRLDALEP